MPHRQPINQYRTYWDDNIARWGELYLEISHGHEKLAGPGWYADLYHATIGRLERKLMVERYARTIAFIDSNVGPGTVFTDIGCGTGIFVIEALRRGAIVNAIDFSSRSLEITKESVNRRCPKGQVTYHQLDVQSAALPISDVTLAMGLSPYLTDLEGFMDRALPATKLWFCLFVDPKHWANRVRAAFPFLNVRGLQSYPKEEVDRLYKKHSWKLKERQKFATGYIDLAGR